MTSGLSALAMRPSVFGWLIRGKQAWVAGGVASATVAVIVVLGVLDGDLSTLVVVPLVLANTSVGFLLLIRRPGHPIGRLLCLIGLTTGLSETMFAYARYTVVLRPGALPFATPALWMNTWVYFPAVCLSDLILLLVFPDGRLLSRRWRPALWAAVAFVPLAIVGSAFMKQTMGGFFRDLPNPYAISSATPLWVALLVLAVVCALSAAVAGAVSLAVRWRRADRVGRQQLECFLVVLPLGVASTIIDVFTLGPSGLFPRFGLIFGAVVGVLIPTAIGVAVLRFRLYEIDVLLNKAALYGTLTAAVAAVYAAVVGVAGLAFAGDRGPAVQAAAVVLAAGALWPMRDRMQRWMNRAFYGDRNAPYKALSRLGHSVQEADAESALNSVVRTIAESLRLDYVAVQTRQGGEWRDAAVYSSGTDRSFPMAFPLVSQRETVGRLLVGSRAPGERLGSDEELLLADLARQAGPAIHAVALRRALDESRAGLVTAREEERRRLRRDLHDGLGPTLAGLTLGFDAALAKCSALPGQSDRPELAELQNLLRQLKAETQKAVGDVRRIVYALRPPALDEFGLAGSLREEIGRLRSQAPGLRITLHVPDDGLCDLPAAVEVACYRIATEALTNVVRHAEAGVCAVRLWRDRGVCVLVQDDGVGLPDGWRAGVGIASMRERVAELGGDLAIEPGPLRGTVITARLPTPEDA